jgi:ATP-dependent helicase/nuclease subunit B
MLRIVQIQSPSQLTQLFSGFDPQAQTWVVSDLRTKLELQKVLIERQGYFLESAVMRASDLWKMLLKRRAPGLRLVSSDFARSLLRSFIDKNADAFGINSTSEKSLFNYMTQLAPLCLASDADEQISKWFQDNPVISARWQTWYLIARTALRWMIDEKKVMIANWIPSYLQELDGLETVWQQSIVVDLGAEMSKLEAELFRRLSRHRDITVIEPSPSWKSHFDYLLEPYEYLRQQTREVSQAEVADSTVTGVVLQRSDAKTEVLRLSGMLAEVKTACAKVRSWLESGIPANEIAIISPDIEDYWPVLSSFLEQEGIQSHKDQTVRLQSLPSLHQWIATLRAQTLRIRSSDLETSYYGMPDGQGLRYEEFKALFKAIYGAEDLARDEKIHRLYFSSRKAEDILDRDLFLAEALKAWRHRESQTDLLITVLRELFQNAAAKIELTYQEWLAYLENILANKEVRVSPGADLGIVVASLMSAPVNGIPYKIFLGLSDESLKNRQRSHILGTDLNRLALDLGFYLEHPDHSSKEFQLQWLAQSSYQHHVYSFGLADFSGSLLSPSNFWMGLSPSEELSEPGQTRWDSLQGTTDEVILSLRERGPEEQERLLNRLLLDRGMLPLPAVNLESTPNLSASQLERYLQCPFIFASQKVFRLQDHPEIDLDEDPRRKGTFAHALFETLTYPTFRRELNDDDLGDILEQLRLGQKVQLADPRLWASMKKRYHQLARRFLNFETQWREEFPQTETVGAEKSFEFYFDSQTGAIQREPQDGWLKFTGKIDRVDRLKSHQSSAPAQYVVIDYKSSHGGYKNHSAWFENQELQLLFYMWALEKEVLSEMHGEVVGAFYYSFKDFNREKGFQIEAQAGPLFRPAGRKGMKATVDDKQELFARFEALLSEVVLKIKSGEIAPRPFDVKTCRTCGWSQLCRAPHLN